MQAWNTNSFNPVFTPLLDEIQKRKDIFINLGTVPTTTSRSNANSKLMCLNLTKLIPIFEGCDSLSISFNHPQQADLKFSATILKDPDFIVICNYQDHKDIAFSLHRHRTHKLLVYSQKAKVAEEHTFETTAYYGEDQSKIKNYRTLCNFTDKFLVGLIPSVNTVAINPVEMEKGYLGRICNGEILLMMLNDNDKTAKVWIRNLNGEWAQKELINYTRLRNGRVVKIPDATISISSSGKTYNDNLTEMEINTLEKNEKTLDEVGIILK